VRNLRFKHWLFLLLIAAGTSARAETVYVIDKLLVGVHAEKSVDSKIIKAFPTGTSLEVEQRDGDMAKIKGPDGITGWVDAVYLSKDPPAALVVDNLEAQNRKLVEDLKQAQDKVSTLNKELETARHQSVSNTTIAAADPAELTQLRQQVDSLQHSLDAERTRSGELQAKLSEIKNTPPADAQTLADLTQENAALKHDLEEVQIQAIKTAETSDPRNSDKVPTSDVLNLPVGVMAFIGFALLVASFLAGVWVMDARQRRRMGGFRI
jgi:SH3 domain protein